MSTNTPSKKRGTGAVHSMFMFMLLAAFALMSVIVVLVGARVYRAVDQRGRDNYDTRTALSYIAGKVRASDVSEQIETVRIDNRDVLTLSADYGGTTYTTYIYVEDGRLMEYFGRKDATFSPAFGEVIAQVSDFHCRLDNQLLSLAITCPDGMERALTLFVQSREVDA